MEQLNVFKKMIAEGQTTEVFNALVKHMDAKSFGTNKSTQPYYNKILLLSSRLKSFDKDSRLGIITIDREKAGRTRINYDLMNLLDEFPNPNSNKTKQQAYLPITDNKLPDEEETFWKNTRKKNNIFFYESYRQLYPKGKYIKIANKRIKDLRAVEKTNQERLKRAKKVAAAKEEEIATDSKLGGLAIFLAIVIGGAAFLTTSDIKITLFTLIGVYVLMVLLSFLFSKSG